MANPKPKPCVKGVSATTLPCAPDHHTNTRGYFWANITRPVNTLVPPHRNIVAHLQRACQKFLLSSHNSKWESTTSCGSRGEQQLRGKTNEKPYILKKEVNSIFSTLSRNYLFVLSLWLNNWWAKGSNTKRWKTTQKGRWGCRRRKKRWETANLVFRGLELNSSHWSDWSHWGEKNWGSKKSLKI